MPEGSLAVNIQTLQTALEAVSGLLGEPPQGAGQGSGLAGAAGLAATSPGDRVSGFGASLTGQVSGLLTFDTSSVTGATDLFGTLQGTAQAPPTQALAGFEQRIAQASSAFGGDFVQQIQQALEAITSISQNVPEDRTAIVSALLDQILDVVGSLDGPEAARIQAWVQSLQELHRTLLPIIEEVQSAPDPAAVALQVIENSLDSTLEILGMGQVRRLVDFMDAFPGNLLPSELLNGLNVALDASGSAYVQAQATLSGPYADFRDQVVAADLALRDLKQALRPFMTVVRRVAHASILQPHALENFLQEQLDIALAVKVSDVQTIEDPFNELFDRIDAAIEGIDLSFVRTEVLGFFEETRSIIEQVDIGSVGDTLQAQLGEVAGAIEDLQQGVTDLLAQIEAFFDSLGQQARSLAEGVGTFQPDGTFQYNFEPQLRQMLTSARTAIGGDPADPSAPSVAGALDEFQTTIDQFLGQLNGMLAPVESAIDTAKTTAVEGINDFVAFVTGLNMPDLIEQLRQQVEQILDNLVPIDFALVIDPVIAEIENSTDSLRDIDADSLNDMLRAALSLALDVIISIDFTATISTPLKDEFAQVKALPQQALDELQARYEQALSMLDALSPEQLLEALFAAFDVIEEAVGSLSLSALLQPLDDLHAQHLQQPLAQLKPSTLLQPVAEAYQGLASALSGLNGADLVAPLTAQLDTLKTAVTGFDITSWVDDLLAAVEQVQQDLQDIRPSELLQPLVDDLTRLESELDRFKPSVLMAPVADLATPLLQFLETVQQETIEALFQLFQEPLQLLDRLEPTAITQEIQQGIDALLAALQGVNLPARYNQIKGQHFDLRVAAEAQGDGARVALVATIDPEVELGEFVTTYNELVAALQSLKQNVELPDLADLYTQLRERLLAMLPPYARELLDPETFKRLMRLADPTRFLEELDQRFEALKERLLPIRPEDITAELDATYDAVLALVDGLDVGDSLNQVKDLMTQIQGIVDSIRVDFVAADIDAALDDLRAMLQALDPARLFDDLDAIHHEVELVVQSTVPSEVLSGLGTTLAEVQALVSSVNPRETLGPPLNEAWEAVEGVLAAIDFTIILSPLVDKLDELEVEFEASLGRTETAFDGMLGAAKSAMGGGASVGVSI